MCVLGDHSQSKCSHSLVLIGFRTRQTLYLLRFDEKKYIFQVEVLAWDGPHLLELT